MLNSCTVDLGSVTTTLIAGAAFDARHAAEIQQTARIYSYTRRIRRLAEEAEPGPSHVPAHVSEPTEVSLPPQPSAEALMTWS